MTNGKTDRWQISGILELLLLLKTFAVLNNYSPDFEDFLDCILVLIIFVFMVELFMVSKTYFSFCDEDCQCKEWVYHFRISYLWGYKVYV